LTLSSLGSFALRLPFYLAHLGTLCTAPPCAIGQITPDALRTFQQMGLSLGGYASLSGAIAIATAGCCFLIAAVLTWRRSDDWLALLVALWLVIWGSSTVTGAFSLGLNTTLDAGQFPAPLVNALSISGIAVVFSLFPTGRFVPRWSFLFTILFIWMECRITVVVVWIGDLTAWERVLDVLIWFTPMTALTLAQVSRSRRVSTPLERQQTRRVVLGATFLSAGFVIWVVNPPWEYVQEDLTWIGTVIALAFAGVYRYRRVSTPLERQQIKWVVFAATLLAVADLVSLAPALLLPTLDPPFTFYNAVRAPLLMVFGLLLPLSIAFGILRYRLWDIDALINKALVYGGLSSLLGALYAGLILGLERLAGIFGGQAASNPLVLAISTLVIAALFLPVRRRIQAIIDRRFYRKKYDAERTLAAFRATLQSEVDLEQIRAQLLAVVQETMHPVHVSLLLRTPERHPEEMTSHLEPSVPPAPRESSEEG
jgi:hypothetical protein